MYLIILDESILTVYIILIISTIGLYFLMKKFSKHQQICIDNSIDTVNEEIIIDKIIHISVNSFRSLVFILTTMNILAVDFDFYNSDFSKSDYWGVSLMDTGVGYFIICHSMRFIRNTKINMNETINSK